MPKFTIGAVEMGQVRASSFPDFVQITKGRSIVSAADFGPARFELGLSGGLMIRVLQQGQSIEVNLLSTLNADEVPPITIVLGDGPQRTPIHLLENKLNGLRTLHAIFFLTQNNRTTELTDFIAAYPDGDIESALLSDEDRLFIESISYGSWILTVWSKTQAAYKSLSSVAGLVYERGREAYLTKLEAEAKTLDHKAHREAIQVAKDSFELQKDQINYLLEISDKFEAPEIREQLKKRIIQSVDHLSLGESDKTDTSRMLPPG